MADKKVVKKVNKSADRVDEFKARLKSRFESDKVRIDAQIKGLEAQKAAINKHLKNL